MVKRGGRLKRLTPLNRVNEERLARRRAVDTAEQAALCRTLACCVCRAPAPSDPHHHPSKAAGGKDKDCVPLCRFCHDQFHSDGIDTFEARHSINLAGIAYDLARQVADA